MKTPKELEDKIAGIEAEVRGMVDTFTARQSQHQAHIAQLQRDFQNYGTQTQVEISQKEGRVLQLRDDLAEMSLEIVEAPPAAETPAAESPPS